MTLLLSLVQWGLPSFYVPGAVVSVAMHRVEQNEGSNLLAPVIKGLLGRLVPLGNSVEVYYRTVGLIIEAFQAGGVARLVEISGAAGGRAQLPLSVPRVYT